MASLARRAILMEIDVPAPYEHVVGVALAPDSDSLVSLAIENSLVLGSSEARTARVDVWAVPSGDLLRSIALTTLGPASSLAVAFRPAIALVSTRGGQIVRLDLATGATSMLLSVPPHPIECVALAADGRRAFAASARGIAVIEDVRSADARIRAAIPVTGARCVATDASGDLAVAAGLEDEVTLLALRASASSESSTMHRAAEPDRGWQVARRWIGGSFVALDGGGRTIAVGSGPNQTVGVWSAEDGRCLRTMEATGSIASVSAVAVSADGRVAAFGGDRGTLWCVRLDGSRARAEFEVVPPRGNPTTDHEEFDRRLAAARALREAGRFGESWRALEAARALPGFAQSEAALDATRTLLPHLARTGVRALVKVREFDLGLEHANVVALRADGRHAAIGSEWTQGEGRGRLACWDLEAAISAGAPRIVSEDAVGGVAYVGRTLIAATKQGLVASIDGSPPTVLAADVKCIVLSPGERVLALLRRNTGEGRIELHDLHRGVRIAEHPIGEWAHCTSVSDSGHLAWWASGAAHVLGPAAGSSPLAIAGASALLARADGSFVVGSQGRLEARAPWRLAAPVWRRAIDDAPISAMCDCAGCDLLAIGDEAGRLALVRGADGAPLSELSFGARIRALALSADGGRLLVGGAGRRAALFAIDWALDPERPSAAVHTPPEEGPSVAQLAAWLGDAR
jgi:WD40 repeat protein